MKFGYSLKIHANVSSGPEEKKRQAVQLRAGPPWLFQSSTDSAHAVLDASTSEGWGGPAEPKGTYPTAAYKC